MGKMISKEFFYFLLAAAVLVLSIPILPSRLILKPVSLSVDADNIVFVRDILVPVTAHWSHEFERITPPPPVRSVECDRSGSAHFEKRNGNPVTYAHGCTFGDGSPSALSSEWEVRMCWEVEMLGLRMRPVCMTRTFFPNAVKLGEQLEMIQRQVETLQMER